VEPAGEAHPLAARPAAGRPAKSAGPAGGAAPPELLAGPAGPELGLYVHCPYCRTKCPYCDFNVAIHRPDRIAPFVAALDADLRRHATLPWAGRVPAVSLFLGGGTPSLLPAAAVAELVRTARRGLGLAADAEVTLEANPEGLDVPGLRALREAGVTRLSLGVQALDDAVLARLGRTHSADDARRAYRAARAAGFANVSVDLLYGSPGQDLDGWLRTLDEVLAWGPEHLSAYALTLEPATPFGRRAPAGLPDEDLQIALFEALVERTARAGLARYEVSNFARPGYRSRHNLLYWRRADYLGLGPGAHGAIGALRYVNDRSEPRWRRAVLAGDWPIAAVERLTPRQVAGERLVLGLRLAEGVPQEWLDRHLRDAPGGAGAALARYVEAGVLTERAGRLALTDRGVLVSDTLFAELV